ncbi:hypothetical protein BKA67DRAFT_562595, partial [Truncatella angustata]
MLAYAFLITFLVSPKHVSIIRVWTQSKEMKCSHSPWQSSWSELGSGKYHFPSASFLMKAQLDTCAYGRMALRSVFI